MKAKLWDTQDSSTVLNGTTTLKTLLFLKLDKDIWDMYHLQQKAAGVQQQKLHHRID